MAENFELNRRGFLKSGTTALALGSRLGLNPLGTATAADEAELVAASIDADPATGTATAVVVGNWPLVHTEQTAVAGAASLTHQLNDLLDAVGKQLAGAGASLDDVVKLNFYLSPQVAAADIEKVLAKRFPGALKPAVCFAAGKLSAVGADVSVDAVAVLRKQVAPGVVLRTPGAAVLPPLDKLYVSGDARPGKLAEATLGTLAGLEQSLKFAKLDWSHVVQLKSFLQPIDAADEVRSVMKGYFGDRPLPVLTFVEWSSGSYPIEIELIAAAPRGDAAAPASELEFLLPPGMTPSPVFSRAALVHSPKTIYVSGLYGDKQPDAPGRIREIFAQLASVLKRTESDLNHLAKATYYVADDVSSKELNKIRPEFYDPKRPPAASKAMVTGVGRAGHHITLDMIAVPRAAKTAAGDNK
ncbi:MAG: RidA family protein [Planctomycetia bacterium]|nr:RidA family protein [Planctomycetia bacterium]